MEWSRGDGPSQPDPFRSENITHQNRLCSSFNFINILRTNFL